MSLCCSSAGGRQAASPKTAAVLQGGSHGAGDPQLQQLPKLGWVAILSSPDFCAVAAVNLVPLRRPFSGCPSRSHKPFFQVTPAGATGCTAGGAVRMCTANTFSCPRLG